MVYFRTRDGRERRMVCRYFGAASSKPHLMKVWDMEKAAPRHINLDTVREIKVLGQDRAAKRRSLEELREEMHALFC